MKKLLLIIAFIAYLIWALTTSCCAATCTNISNGVWSNSLNWTCLHVPTSGDTVVIKTGSTVSLTGNAGLGPLPSYIKVYGLLVVSNYTLATSCCSTIEIFSGGKVTTGDDGGVKICDHKVIDEETTTTGYVKLTSCIATPIKFSSFSIRHENERVFIEWTTTYEANITWFIIEKSYDMETWVEIGNIPAQNSGFLTTKYSVEDLGEIMVYNYYRMKYKDSDSIVTSEILGYNNIKDAIKWIMVGNTFYYQSTIPYELAISDMMGNQLAYLGLGVGENRIYMPLIPGVYNFVLISQKDTSATKILIQ